MAILRIDIFYYWKVKLTLSILIIIALSSCRTVSDGVGHNYLGRYWTKTLINNKGEKKDYVELGALGFLITKDRVGSIGCSEKILKVLRKRGGTCIIITRSWEFRLNGKNSNFQVLLKDLSKSDTSLTGILVKSKSLGQNKDLSEKPSKTDTAKKKSEK